MTVRADESQRESVLLLCEPYLPHVCWRLLRLLGHAQPPPRCTEDQDIITCKRIGILHTRLQQASELIHSDSYLPYTYSPHRAQVTRPLTMQPCSTHPRSYFFTSTTHMTDKPT